MVLHTMRAWEGNHTQQPSCYNIYNINIMEKTKTKPNAVTVCNNIEKEKNLNKGVTVCNNIKAKLNGFLEFASFILRARFNNENNLKLAYLLTFSKNISIAEAAIILNVSRTLFYTKILPENPAFESAVRSVSGWGHGGKERRIKLTEEAAKYTVLIQQLAEVHLGERECKRLREAAQKVKRRALKVEESRNKKLEKAKRVLAQQLQRYGSWEAIPRERIMFWCRETRIPEEELRQEVEG